MCSGWCDIWVTRQHERCNNENMLFVCCVKMVQFNKICYMYTAERGQSYSTVVKPRDSPCVSTKSCRLATHCTTKLGGEIQSLHEILQKQLLGNIFTICRSNVKYWGGGGTAMKQRLRCCATNRKVAGSIPDGLIGIFWHKILPIALWTWGRLSL